MGLELYDTPKIAEANSLPDGILWEQAVQNEVNTLERLEAWVPEIVPKGAKVLDSRFLLVLRRKADGVIDKYKACLVVKGFQEGHR